jgi:hypothetical protein
MAIKSNALAENKAAILAEDGGTIYATLQMRHGKESEMDESKFVPAEIGVATDTKKAVIAFGPGDTKEFAFKDDIPDQDYNNLENKPSIGGVELSGDKSLEQLGIQQKGDYITEIPAEYVTDTKLTEKLKSYPTKEEQAEELEKKLDKDQGAENTGKALVVGEDGTVKPGEIPIKVDDTLSQTGQAADAEKVGARLHEIDAVKLRGPVETVSGEILQIENPAEQPPVGMRVYGKAEQNTTTGAQLLNAPDKTNKIFGVTMSVSGGIASFSGTLSSNNATFWFIGSYNGVDVVMTLPAGKYYLQNCSMQTLGNSALKTGAITSETEIQITGVAYTYTDSSPKTIYPMINAGSKALPWEPYTGEKPSPSPEYPQEIEIPGSDGKIETSMNGKNLATGRLYYVNYSDGHAFIFNKEDVKLPYTPKAESNGIGYIIPCKKGRTYTLSVTNPNKNASLGITEYRNEEEMNNQENNINSVIAGGEAKSQTITAIGNGVLVCMLASVWTDGKSRIHTCTESELLQVEIGEEATEYEPPRKSQSLVLSTKNGLSGLPVDGSGNYTDSNGQQWICDSVKFYSDGTGKKIQRLKRASGLVFKRVNYGIQEESYLYEAYLSDLAENDYPPCLCTGLKYDKKILDNNLNGMYAYPKSIRARFKDSKNEQEDIEKLKTFEFLYVLQTPIETDLSSEEIAAYRALKLYNPVVNVFTAESLMPGIAVDYVPETEDYIEKSINENTQKAPAIAEKASGETLNVTDSSDLGLKGLKVLGKSQQVTTTGAQLFDASKLPTKSANGATVTNNGDGSFTISGSGTLSGEFRQAYDLNHEESVRLLKKGFLNLRANKTEPYVSIVIYFNESQKELNTTSKEETRLEILENEINNESFHIKVQFYGRIGKEIVSGIVKPMLYQDGDGTWELYTGRQPSPSPEYPQEIKIPGSDGSLEVRVFGAQLIAKTYASATINGITYTVNDDGSVTANGKATSNSFFLLSMLPKANDVFLSGGKSESISIVYTNMVNKGYKDVGNGIYIPNQFDYEKYPNSRIQIQITEGATVTNEIIRPMLNAGSTALPWEPCKLQPLTLSTPNGLPGIPVDSGGNYMDAEGQEWVCDEVDFKAEKYIRRVYTETVSLSAQEGEGGVRYVGKTTYVPGRIEAISSTLQYNRVAGYTTNGVRAVVNNNDIQVVAHYEDKILTEIDLVYVLKTPIETDLTSEEIAAYRALHTNYSTTNVFTDSDPQVGLEMEYVADTKSYIDKKFEELQKALVNTNTQVLNKVIMEDIEHA